MSNHSEIFLTDGQSYQLAVGVEEVIKNLVDADGKAKEGFHAFESASGKALYVNPQHVILVTNYQSPDDPVSEPNSSKEEQPMDDEERKEHNLQEAKKFGEEIDDMK